MFRSSAARVASVFQSTAPHLPSIAAPQARSTQAVDIRRPNVQLRRLQASDVQWLPALCDLLIDGVHHGASLGFLAPMSRYAAMDYWHGVFARLGQHHGLWIACEGDSGPLQACVQLALCTGANAHHRGQVQQMMVHSQSRGRGIASLLMQRLECAALDQGRTLLVLETPSCSQAEAVFAHLGWERAGEIPDYGSCAEGRLHGSAMYFKRLRKQAPSK